MTTPATEGSATRRAPRWMWALLIVSLGLNLLIIGGAVGAAWHHHRHGAEGRSLNGPYRILWHYSEHLPVERRDALQAILKTEGELIRTLRREAREARRRAISRFAAEPFDAAAFSEANREAIRTRVALIEASQALFPRVADQLTGAERRDLIEKMQRGRRWGRWRRASDEP